MFIFEANFRSVLNRLIIFFEGFEMSLLFIAGLIISVLLPIAAFFVIPWHYEKSKKKGNIATVNATMIGIMFFFIAILAVLVAHGSVESLLHKESLGNHNFKNSISRFNDNVDSLFPSDIRRVTDFDVIDIDETIKFENYKAYSRSKFSLKLKAEAKGKKFVYNTGQLTSIYSYYDLNPVIYFDLESGKRINYTASDESYVILPSRCDIQLTLDIPDFAFNSNGIVNLIIDFTLVGWDKEHPPYVFAFDSRIYPNFLGTYKATLLFRAKLWHHMVFVHKPGESPEDEDLLNVDRELTENLTMFYDDSFQNGAWRDKLGNRRGYFVYTSTKKAPKHPIVIVFEEGENQF